MRILLVQPAPFEDRRLGLENTFWFRAGRIDQHRNDGRRRTRSQKS